MLPDNANHDTVARPVVLARTQHHERLSPLAATTELGRERPVQVTINVTPVMPSCTPTSPVKSTRQRLVHFHWMPWYPFVVLYGSYKDGYAEAKRYPGLLRALLWIAMATGAAAILWRQWTTPISVVGGLVAFFVIAARTGQLRDVVEAFQAVEGMPPLLTLLELVGFTLVRKARRR